MRLLRQASGFTLIELMITIAIVAILASVAMPAYTAYVQRSRVPVALDGLSAYLTRMEQRYQDVGSYANAANACAVAVPAADNFVVTCAISNGRAGLHRHRHRQRPVAGYAFTINHQRRARHHRPSRRAPRRPTAGAHGGTCDS